MYLITSADHHDTHPAVLSTWVQGPWGIENRLHWVRDVAFDEDRSQVSRWSRTPRHSHHPQHRHQHPAADRLGQHHPSPTTSRPIPRTLP